MGMSKDAVKFGRMSKKQRERVEDEVGTITYYFIQPGSKRPEKNLFLGNNDHETEG